MCNEVWIPALEREDVCHHVGFGPGWSRCGRHNVWLAKKKKVLMASSPFIDPYVCDFPF